MALSAVKKLNHLDPKMKNLLFLAICLLTLACTKPQSTTDRPPNIVYILADDLGYGDIAAFNPDWKNKNA